MEVTGVVTIGTKERSMRDMKKVFFAFSLIAAVAMTACIPETRNQMLGIPDDAILLSTENFTNPNAKTSVSGTSVMWVGEEDIAMYVGAKDSNQARKVKISEGNAYISSALEGTGDIRGYYPAGIISGNPTTNNPVVVYPSEYSCSVSGGRQVIELPMAGFAESGATSIKFKHLTAAINLMLKNSLGSALNVDSVIVEADKYGLWLNGKTLTLTAENLSVTPRVGSAAEKKVKVLFPSALLVPPSSEDRCIQIPIAPIGEDKDSLTIKVYCHSASASYVYSYKDKTSTAIARNEVLTAMVDLNLSGHMEEIVIIENVIDLSSVTTSAISVNDGDVLTGTPTTNFQCNISSGATVKFRGVNSTGNKTIRIVANGNATIVISGTNKISNGSYPCLRVMPSYTLTIKDDPTNAVEDSLVVVSSSGSYAAIGSGTGADSCGNIIINGGFIIAQNTSTGSTGAAGIGCGSANCGSITINRGTVESTGSAKAAGIGASGRTCTCGNITINGGTVTSVGGSGAAGIGTGNYSTSKCGAITVSSSNTSVVATKGSGATACIGAGYKHQSNCGTVTIGSDVKTITINGKNYPGVDANNGSTNTYTYPTSK